MGDLEELRKTYCPPLDEALFYAIAGDFDLENDRNELISQLDALKADALEQGDADFDPSGTSRLMLEDGNTQDSRTNPEDDTASNGITSITSEFSGFGLNDDVLVGKDIESLPDQQKVAWLHHMFPGIDATKIEQALGRNQAAVDRTIDELLNLSFLGQDADDTATPSPLPKGVDGFAQENLGRPRKGRAKKQNRSQRSTRDSSSTSLHAESTGNPGNVWSKTDSEVEFICSRTTLQPTVVKSAYHASGMSLPRTIRTLARKYGAPYNDLSEIDAITQLHLADFRQEYPSISPTEIYGLLILARNIISAADELLAALVTADHDTDPLQPGKLLVQAHYSPIDLDSEKAFESTPEKSWTTVNHGDLRQLAAAHGMAANHAFTQASSAYRRGKSDHLMGGAAAYYAEVGHERVKIAKALQAVAADDHVSAQSSGRAIDLHGVSVADAVRIASSRTQNWWDGLGDAKYASGGGGSRREGFKIVTGVGTHSKNHAPRIGPAVSRRLINEGWKVEIGHGELIVVGKVRR